ncbi:hypothetical protein [Bradyrhizobium sp. HKCCYLS20291]|uniref:hypothetical protein n=1 Tax=Bradyrhizobium sp. HKCCYLS20291 TaxID=3420766 RepID=UPI003EBB3A60
MVYTRPTRSKKPLTYSTGGAVPVMDAPPPAPPPADDAALKHALEAQRRAEEMARAKPLTIEEQIDAMPNLSDANRQWLKTYPRLISPDVAPLAHRAYAMARAEGVPDDSDEMRERVTREVAADLERMEKARSGALRTDPAVEPEPEPEPEPAYEPPAVVAARPAPPPQRPQAPRRSLPGGVAAPVSREVHSGSGRREAPSTHTLTAEERAIARNSFGAVNGTGLSDDQKERLYLQNKLRYQAMVANGEYSKQTER